ncbi:uncharacterized protein LOC121351379 [Pyrgilauda ruficollis]|uniref:uncharacterized protein LOC121351379 n=1 Tax=Pyrgilauda ruficollis TaxID=221976 RepID=UPI001B86A8E5|nr:uncharacterized protein LOC121351379 [Pyrgilauda ruficollis]
MGSRERPPGRPRILEEEEWRKGEREREQGTGGSRGETEAADGKAGVAQGRTAQPSSGSGVSAGKGWGGCGKQRHNHRCCTKSCRIPANWPLLPIALPPPESTSLLPSPAPGLDLTGGRFLLPLCTGTRRPRPCVLCPRSALLTPNHRCSAPDQRGEMNSQQAGRNRLKESPSRSSPQGIAVHLTLVFSAGVVTETARWRQNCCTSSPQEARMSRGHLSHEGRLGELGLFSLEKRRLQSDPIAAFQYLSHLGADKKDGEKLWTKAWSARARGNGFHCQRAEIDGILGRNPSL